MYSYMFCALQVCPSEGVDGKLWPLGAVQINTFHFPWMLDRHWKRDCLHWDSEHPPLAFLPPVFQSPQRHDPFKWLFTCIRRRAKALLNEVLSTIQLEWTSQQHNFPLSTMLTSAEQKHRQKYEDQRPAVVTPAAAKCRNMSVDSHSLFVFVLLSNVKFNINKNKWAQWKDSYCISGRSLTRRLITRNVCSFSTPIFRDCGNTSWVIH